MLRARSPRAAAVPGSQPSPTASNDSNVTYVVSICRCRAEDSVLRRCRNTLSNPAGPLSVWRFGDDITQTVASGMTGQFHPLDMRPRDFLNKETIASDFLQGGKLQVGVLVFGRGRGG